MVEEEEKGDGAKKEEERARDGETERETEKPDTEQGETSLMYRYMLTV